MGSGRIDRALIALFVGFVALAGAVLATVWLSEAQERAARLVRHTLEVENQVGDVLSSLQQAETSQRGYLLTGHETFLPPYEAGVAAAKRDLAALERAVADNPRQLARVVRLEGEVGARIVLLRENVNSYRRGESIDSYAERFDRGRLTMEAVRRTVAEMKSEEERLLSTRTGQMRQQQNGVRSGLIVSILAVLVLGVFAVVDARRRLRLADRARESLADANLRLRAEAESREAAEAQVRQVQKTQAIGQLTGGIAHDFNNMLAIIVGSLDLAKRRLKSDPAKAEVGIDHALEGAHRAAQLTARLLAFSRQQPLAPRVVDTNKLVGDVSELLRRTIGETIQVETVLAGGLWRCFADPAQLENAIVNLCVNARDAMPDGGRLTIETSNAYLDDAYANDHTDVRAGQYVMISVTDTGCGMPPEVAERAFDPFYTTKGAGRGTGLGLSQVHGFVKQSQGHVKIYSEPGVGTTMKIYLPRSTAEVGATDLPARPSDAVAGGRREEIILVVEDDDRVRRMSVDALRELGYTVVHASDATGALKLLEQPSRFCLLFTDVVMPDMDGRRLADQARTTRPDLKVLYTTGYTKNAIVHNGMLDADVAFLAKPFTVEQLAAKVRQVLDELKIEPADS
jgi:signal transduction histidine kinase/CheY-like chemotaxis protein